MRRAHRPWTVNASRPEGAALADWLARIETLHPRRIAPGLERVRTVARRLLPERGVPTVVVAGTNGKGTTASLIATALQHAGLRVGLYTSPHLLRYNERVRIDGVEADDAQLCAAFEAVESCRGDVPLTYFEFGTLAALHCFSEAQVDARVLEVGMGGRLDAVNLVDADIAVITNVGLDHTDWLGPTIEDIAREKAGVLRPGRVGIFGRAQVPESLRRHAEAIGARLRVRDADFTATVAGDCWEYGCGALRWSGLPLAGGEAWLDNAACAAAALQHWPGVDGQAALRAAIPDAALPGRCQQHGDLLLDVSHNAEAAQALARALRGRPRPRVAVLGMLADKPASDYVAALREQVDQWLLVDLGGERGQSAQALAGRIAPLGVAARCCGQMPTALAQARRLVAGGGTIVVCGSFLTVAAALQAEAGREAA